MHVCSNHNQALGPAVAALNAGVIANATVVESSVFGYLYCIRACMVRTALLTIFAAGAAIVSAVLFSVHHMQNLVNDCQMTFSIPVFTQVPLESSVEYSITQSSVSTKTSTSSRISHVLGDNLTALQAPVGSSRFVFKYDLYRHTHGYKAGALTLSGHPYLFLPGHKGWYVPITC